MPDEDEEEGLDLGAVAGYAGYVLRAPKRQPWRFAALLGGSIALATAVYVLYPRTYSTEVKILAQRNLILPALGNPNRTVPRDADNPTKNVADMIMKHDNLVGLIKQVNLLDRWESSRPPLLRLKDRITRRLSHSMSEQDRMRAIEGVLEKRLNVTNDDSTITIVADWTDARMAYDLASALEKNFVDARYDAEISVIDDAIDILQQHASEEKARFDQARVDFESIDVKKPQPKLPALQRLASEAPSRPRYEPPPQAHDAVDPALLQALADKRNAIQQIESQRAARVADLDKQLSDALVIYRPEHPTIVALKQQLAQAQADSPDLVRLKGEERALIDRVAASAPQTVGAVTVAAALPRHASARTIAAIASPNGSPFIVEEDPAVTVARMRLQQSAQKYADLETRIDGAKIELDIAKTAHKYRYSIVRPAEVSTHAHKPNPLVLAAGLMMLVFFLSFGGVALYERHRGIVVEPSQLARKLKVPLLGELET